VYAYVVLQPDGHAGAGGFATEAIIAAAVYVVTVS
jgi:hypothetical protein